MRRRILCIATFAIMMIAAGWSKGAKGQATAANQTDVGVATTVGLGGNAFNNSPVTAGSSAQGGAGGAGGNGTSTSSLSFNYAPVTYSVYPDPRAQVVNPQVPGSPWWQPNENQIALWNDFSSPPGSYERPWTMDEVNAILDNAGWEGFGFKCSPDLFRKHPPTSRITVRWLQMVVKREQIPDPNSKDGKGVLIRETSIGIPPERLPGNLWMGGIDGKGSKNKTMDILLAKLLKAAMRNGASYAVINYHGMNIHYMGQSLAPGIGAASAGIWSSLSGTGGANFTKAGANGDPTLRIALYEADGEDAKKLEVPSQRGIQQGKKGKDSKKESGEVRKDKINPDVLKSSKDWNWGGGVPTSPEMQRRAQMTPEQIMGFESKMK